MKKKNEVKINNFNANKRMIYLFCSKILKLIKYKRECVIMINVLLVEPNYKNKYPPIGLMKLATYFRMKGYNVIFFKGDLKDLAVDLLCSDFFLDIAFIDNSVFWNLYYPQIFNFIRSGHFKYISTEPLLIRDDVFTLLKCYRQKYRDKDYFVNPKFDIVAVTTLFTFYWDITIDTINFVKRLCKNLSNVLVGGILATILPDRVFEATGLSPHVGLLDKSFIFSDYDGDYNNDDDDVIIDTLPLDYSILEEIDYIYPVSNAYFVHTTRGCPNSCSFCAVPKLEPIYCDYKSIKECIAYTDELFGAKKDLLLMDNNVLASTSYDTIIDDIKLCGFGYNSTYVPPDEYSIAIRNLRAGYNDRAYIKKIVKLYNKFFEQLKEPVKNALYDFINDKYCLYYYSATKEAILDIDVYMSLHNIKLRKSRLQKRFIDFNQGVEAKLVTSNNMSKLAETSIRPLRIAFDHWVLRDVYKKAIISAVQNNITSLSNYILYNHNDTPNELYLRLKLNVELCEELNANIYSFPMKYHPIDDPNFFSNRNYQGMHWNKKYIRAVQCMLNTTKGKVGRGLSFFNFNFGANLDEFNMLLLMPEMFIIHRNKFKVLIDNWWTAFNMLSEEQQVIVKNIIFTNDFNVLTRDDTINLFLRYYKM